MSTSPVASPAVGSSQAPWRMSIFQPGLARPNAATMSWVASLAALAMNPTRSTWAARLAAPLVSRTALSHLASSAGTCSARTRPGSVSAIPLWERSNSWVRSCASSCRTWLVSAGCATYNRCAAPVTLPSSATAMK